MTRLPPAVALLCAAALAWGCSANAGPAPQTAGAAPAATPMAQLVLAAADAPQAPNGPATQRFLDLALNARDDRTLRAFDLSEEAFVALDAQERTATLERYSRISAGLRRLARAGAQRARAAAAAGDAETARRLLDAIERVGAANDRRDVVKIGQLTAQAVLRLVQNTRRELFSPADGRASALTPG